jgi:hypothetical protein
MRAAVTQKASFTLVKAANGKHKRKMTKGRINDQKTSKMTGVNACFAIQLSNTLPHSRGVYICKRVA